MSTVRPARILTVDDDEMNRDMLCRRLQRQGHTVDAVPGGHEAMRVLGERKTDVLSKQFDVILLDVMMPEMDGFECLELIKADPDLRHIPVLMISAADDDDAVLRCIEAGAEDYLHKPFDMVMLKARIGACVRKKDLFNRMVTSMEELKQAKRKDQDLLRSVLPEEIAAEIQREGRATPRKFNSATVLFTDFEGFTKVSEEMHPDELLQELDACFGRFDDIAVQHNLLTIKTIGDGYMCSGGLPVENRTHPIDSVLAALQMLAFVRERGEARQERHLPFWNVRIGIHTGPLIAGVVGRNRPTYDVWGDTVNTASRMESSGEPGKINISASTESLVRDFFVAESRGPVPVKNKDPIEMYFIGGIRPELSRSGDAIVPEREFWNRYETFDDTRH